MATIHFLGTCSGTEPMEGMHHTSTVIEADGAYYWFDAGENCSYTAYLSGIDPLKTRAIFLSHMHVDHTGGLANLFFCITKMIALGKGRGAYDNTVTVTSPDPALVDAIKRVSVGGADPSALRFETRDVRTHDGVVYDDGTLRVTALHNTHLGEDGTNGWHAYSFLVEVEGKRVLLSGDVGSVDELTPLIGEGCDLLVMETGHHKVGDVCEYAVERGITRLRFTHHGREIINGRAAAQTLVASFGRDFRISFDGLCEEI